MSTYNLKTALSTLAVLVMAAGLNAAENRTPTPEEFREMMRQYNGSGKLPVAQSQQPPRGALEFNRALTLHTKKGANSAELKEAASLYQIAIEAGIPQAGTNLALLFIEGKGVKKDVKKALALLQAASKKNDSQADVALARLHLIGKDIPRDDKKGEALLTKAAKAGNQNAVTMLAEFKEWKIKNEKSMKEYQELLKQAQAAQNRQGTIQPLQILPQPPSFAKSGLQFPVIPGYDYIAGKPAPMPNFTARPPQPTVLNATPLNASDVLQQITAVPRPNATPPAPVVVTAPAPTVEKSAVQPAAPPSVSEQAPPSPVK